MVGLVGGDSSDASGKLGVQVLGGGISVGSDGPVLMSVGGGPRRDVPVVVSVRDAVSRGAELFVATYEQQAAEPRADWEATLAACRASDSCKNPETLRVDDTDLVRTDDGSLGWEDSLRGSVDAPPDGSWLLVGDLDGRRDQALTVRLGDSAPAFVDAGKPVLLRLPDDGPVDYSATTRATGSHRLFATVYEPVAD